MADTTEHSIWQPGNSPKKANVGIHPHRRVLEMRGAFHEEVMSDLTLEEREALDRILGKLTYRLQTMP